MKQVNGSKNSVVEAVQSVVGSVDVAPVDALSLLIAEQQADIDKVADMQIAIERQLDDVENGKSGIASILRDVLLSQGVLTFAWSEVVRMSWGDAYRSRKGLPSDKNGDNVVNVAWHRVLKYTTDIFPECAKPKAETKESDKKAAQRAKQAELLAAYEDVPVSDIKAQIKSLYNKAGDGGKGAKEAKAEASKLEKVVTAMQSAEVKAQKDEVKGLKDRIKEALKSVSDVFVLSDVADMLESALDHDVDVDAE